MAAHHSTPAGSSADGTPRSGGGFTPTGSPSRGGNSSRGADSRRLPRVTVPNVTVPNVTVPSDGAVSQGLDAGVSDQPFGQRSSSCTLAQMRRFIKSRPYVPVHELRRRFLIDGIEDDVSPVVTAQRTVFVGLPPREAQFLSDLIRGGEVGCEMLLDPTSPGVVGVYPMRPVARQ